MTDAYAASAYHPQRIPQQPPSSERSWLAKLARMRLPWGATQELAPIKFFYQDTPEDLRQGEQLKAEDEARKIQGTYEPRITEIEDFHYIYDHQRHRFAMLSMGGRFWTALYAFGKGGFWILLPILIITCLIMAMDSDIPFLEDFVSLFKQTFMILCVPPLLMWIISSVVIHKFPKLWARPSRGPLWEFNRQTGMVTVFDYDNNGQYKKHGSIGELTAPFHEFDAYLSSSPDRQGLPMNVLHLAHRYRDIQFCLAPLLHQSSDANDHFALWDYLQNYMDISRPLPDIPYLEQYRHLDPTTAEHDRRTGRNPRQWLEMDDAGFKAKLAEIRTGIHCIDTLSRPNHMAQYCQYRD